MSISILIQPPDTWTPPVPRPVVTSNTAVSSKQPCWQDYAAEEDWKNAIVAYLRSRPRQEAPYWQTIHAVVGESIQASPEGERNATRAVLQALQQLRRERRIMRFRRRLLALLEAPPVIPLEQIPKGHLART